MQCFRCFFFSSRRRHTRFDCDWSSDVCSSDLGKGTFTNGFKGGVKFCKTKHDAKEMAGNMLGQTLVTAQTGPAGRKVRSEERRVGKSGDPGGRRIIKKKKE